MTPKSTTAVALAATALAVPAVALADANDPPSPVRTALRAPLAGHLSAAAQMRADRRATLQDRLTPTAVRLAGRLARVRGNDFSARAERRELRGESPSALRNRIRGLRGDLATASVSIPPHLQAIAACESGGDPSADTGNGYFGKYQFSASTWAAVGGTGNPAAASEAEQDRRAAALYAQAGPSQWPVCGG